VFNRSPIRLLEQDTLLSGRRGRYRVDDWINKPGKRPGSSTPGYTPTSLSPRLVRSRPQLYRAVNQKTGKTVAVKAIDLIYQQYLLNEARSLNVLHKYSPRLIERLRVHDRKIAYIVYEWFDEDEWVSLKTEIEDDLKGSLNGREKCKLLYESLRKSLQRSLNYIHSKGVIHGDLKPEHILVHRKSPQHTSEFDQIKLIDFGLSYLEKTEKWRGGSLGFTNPYFWESGNRRILDRRQLLAIDRYGVNALMYYAYTGAHFPAASPAYRYLINTQDPNTKRYYSSLSNLIFNENPLDDSPQDFPHVVERLCQPDNFSDSVVKPSPVRNVNRFLEANSWMAAFSFLLAGCALASPLDINLRIFLTAVSLLSLIVLGLKNLDPPTKRPWIKNERPLLLRRTLKNAYDLIAILVLHYLDVAYYTSSGLTMTMLVGLGSVFIPFIPNLSNMQWAFITLAAFGPLVLPGFISFTLPLLLGWISGKMGQKMLWAAPLAAALSWLINLVNGNEVLADYRMELADSTTLITFLLLTLIWTGMAFFSQKSQVTLAKLSRMGWIFLAHLSYLFLIVIMLYLQGYLLQDITGRLLPYFIPPAVSLVVFIAAIALQPRRGDIEDA